MGQFGLNTETVGIGLAVVTHIAAMTWWGSSINSRLKALEKNRDDFSDRLILLETHIKENRDMLHKIEVMLARIEERVGGKKVPSAESIKEPTS